MKTKEAEVVKENQLAVIVRESQLEPTKAKFILEKFTDYFEIASDWEKKAKAIVVTKETQTAEMAMAREGRLFLKEKRVAVEKARKELKEQALREGKAIDGIANVLKALIVPIEEYLEHQERFVEIQQEQKEATMRLEIEKRMEDERLAKEKADAEALDKARLENERLKQEASRREKQALAERAEQEKVLAKERAKAQAERIAQDKKLAAERAKAEAERKEIEDMARAEREKREEALALERAKVERQKRIAEEKARVEKEKERAKTDAERKEKERLAEMLKNQILCPKCGHKFQLNKEAR